MLQLFNDAVRQSINKLGIAQGFFVRLDVLSNNRIDVGRSIARLTPELVFVQALERYNST